MNKMIFLILGIIDLLAGIILYFVTGISIVKIIALILIGKGIWTVLKHFFNW